mmetsp:Transcript_32832/g.58202  ORF Transcript_32832/g.58202 Transcript_32832/m.58202 type:complete len:102 (-) Transcript_32832:1415-1720(-)
MRTSALTESKDPCLMLLRRQTSTCMNCWCSMTTRLLSIRFAISYLVHRLNYPSRSLQDSLPMPPVSLTKRALTTFIDEVAVCCMYVVHGLTFSNSLCFIST